MPKLTLEALLQAYFTIVPNASEKAQRVSFGTSGHRGKALQGSFNEAHILAITQAVCEFRASQGITGPLYIGKDTHALSSPAHDTALEVLAANGVRVIIHRNNLPTPTPVISHAILAYNQGKPRDRADGIVVTPSHNPPEDGGFKYNEPHGGPASTATTGWIEKRANELLSSGNAGVQRMPLEKALQSGCIHPADLITPYVDDLLRVVNMQAIAQSGISLGADPLGGAALPYWEPIAQKYGLNLQVVRPTLDPLFAFMPPDHDGKTRMDCSSLQAMAGLIAMAKDYDLSFGNDPDADRHGIVTPEGLMPPNHFLSVVVWYLLRHRPWTKGAVGKTCVTTSLIDRICTQKGRATVEVPVGFKWFVEGLLDGSLIFGGEESAGASLLTLEGTPWSTDKDGIILNLLAAEITAVTGKNPAILYKEITKELGCPFFTRVDTAASPAQANALKTLNPQDIAATTLAGEAISKIISHAEGNGEAIGGIKVICPNGWFAARPSGTEPLYKIYAESFVSEEHLQTILVEAKAMVADCFSRNGIV